MIDTVNLNCKIYRCLTVFQRNVIQFQCKKKMEKIDKKVTAKGFEPLTLRAEI